MNFYHLWLAPRGASGLASTPRLVASQARRFCCAPFRTSHPSAARMIETQMRLEADAPVLAKVDTSGLEPCVGAGGVGVGLGVGSGVGVGVGDGLGTGLGVGSGVGVGVKSGVGVGLGVGSGVGVGVGDGLGTGLGVGSGVGVGVKSGVGVGLGVGVGSGAGGSGHSCVEGSHSMQPFPSQEGGVVARDGPPKRRTVPRRPMRVASRATLSGVLFLGSVVVMFPLSLVGVADIKVHCPVMLESEISHISIRTLLFYHKK